MTDLESLAAVLDPDAWADDPANINRLASTKYWEQRKAASVIKVRRVVEAMRTPTQVQYDALSATDKTWRELNSETVWQVYIDAILADPASKPLDKAQKTG